MIGKQLGTPFKVREHSDGVMLNWDIQDASMVSKIAQEYIRNGR